MTAFGKQGIAETSVLQLTHAAGVSNGTFYRYFDDKEQLEYAIGASCWPNWSDPRADAAGRAGPSASRSVRSG